MLKFKRFGDDLWVVSRWFDGEMWGEILMGSKGCLLIQIKNLFEDDLKVFNGRDLWVLKI